MSDPNESEPNAEPCEPTAEPPKPTTPPAKLNLSREAIKAADDRKLVPLDVPEWGGTVYIRTLTGREMDLLQQTTVKTKGKNVTENLANFRARVAIACVTDDAGKDLFLVTDLQWLTEKSAKPLTRIYNLALELNGVTADDVDELTKNCEGGPS